MAAIPTLRDLQRRGVMRLTGHAELFKRNEETGELTLVSTTRPCEICGRPLEGLVIPKKQARDEGQDLVHPKCKGGTAKVSLHIVGGHRG